MMRLARAISIFATIAVAALTGRADEFPYQGHISDNDVYVRSGPGQDYYPTDKLPRGAAVEIWRHDPGGWYAVRPPEGSFSWVGARHLKLADDNIAEVIDDGVAAYVGSRLSDNHDVQHVKLDRGEYVEIVGEKRLAGPGAAASETWYKIAPPSGEFRWILGRDVTPREVAATNADQRESSPGASSTAGEAAQGHVAKSELQQLNLELSTIITQPPLDWQLDELHTRAGRELDKAESALVRDRARRLLDEIERCQRLQQEYREFAQADRGIDRRNQFAEDAAARSAETDGQVDVADPIVTSGYDGVGRLTPVKSRRSDAPRYALIDSDGSLLMFISEAPGVDMQRYIGQKVGVTGTRGFIAQLRKPHVTARVVEPLEPSVLVARKQADR